MIWPNKLYSLFFTSVAVSVKKWLRWREKKALGKWLSAMGTGWGPPTSTDTMSERNTWPSENNRRTGCIREGANDSNNVGVCGAAFAEM